MNAAPELVTLHVWRVPRAAAAAGRWAGWPGDPGRLRAPPGVRFAKLLGTGTGTGFGPGDADLTRWAALVVWDSPAAAAGFDASPVGPRLGPDRPLLGPAGAAPGDQPGRVVRAGVRSAIRRAAGSTGRCWR